MRAALLACGSVLLGVGLTRWYDRSPKAHRVVFWLYTADIRADARAGR